MSTLFGFALILPAGFFVLSCPTVKKRDFELVVPAKGRSFTHRFLSKGKKIRIHCPDCLCHSLVKEVELLEFEKPKKTTDEKTRFVNLVPVEKKRIYHCSCGAYLALKNQ